MNKRYFAILGAIAIFLIVFVVILLFQQEPTVPRQKVIVNAPYRGTPAPRRVIPTLSLPHLASSPKEAALQFYTYYTTAPQNPFANGAYKESPYLSPEFKTIVAAGNGNMPVFCPQNKKANVVVGKEQTYYYDNGYLTQEVIREAPPGTKDLYTITLKNVDGKWFIFDINCRS
jgi:hypothetical protein